MAPWLIAVLRVLGIRTAADVVPVARKVGDAVSDLVNPPEPSHPLTYADTRWIESQKASATAHKVASPEQPGQGTRAVAAASAPAAGAVREPPSSAGGAVPQAREGGGAAAPAVRAFPLPPSSRVDRKAITPRPKPPRPKESKK